MTEGHFVSRIWAVNSVGWPVEASAQLVGNPFVEAEIARLGLVSRHLQVLSQSEVDILPWRDGTDQCSPS